MCSIKYFLAVNIFMLSGLTASAQQVAYAIMPGKGISSMSSFSEGVAKAKMGLGKTGFVDNTGKFVVKAIYEDAGSFHDGLAWVSKTIDNNLKYGFIDKTGALQIPFLFDEVKDFSFNRAAVKKSGRWQYIDKRGKMVLNSSFVRIDTLIDNMYNGAYNEIKANPTSFHSGLLLVHRGNRYGYADTSGKMIIPPKFYMARDFSDGVALIVTDTVVSAQMPGNDTLNKMYNKLPPDPATFKWSLIDSTGKVLCTLDSAKSIKELGEGLTAFTNGDDYSAIWGIVNKNGKVILTPQFEKEPIGCSDGVVLVQVDGQSGDNKDGYLLTFDKAGNRIAKIPLCNASNCINDSNLNFHEGLLAVKIGRMWGYIDKTGNMAIPPKFDTALDFQNGLAVIVTMDSQVGAINNPLKEKR